MANDSSNSTRQVMTSVCLSCSLADTCGVDQSGLIFPIDDIEDLGTCPLLDGPQIPVEPETNGHLQLESVIDPVNLHAAHSSRSATQLTIPDPTPTACSSRSIARPMPPHPKVLAEELWQKYHRSVSSGEEASDELVQPKPEIGKEAHRLTEKRYRSNMNEKLQALRDVLPSYGSLRHHVDHTPHGASEITSTRPQKAAGIHRRRHVKYNKGAILSEALTYIRNLEQRIEELQGKDMDNPYVERSIDEEQRDWFMKNHPRTMQHH